MRLFRPAPLLAVLVLAGCAAPRPAPQPQVPVPPPPPRGEPPAYLGLTAAQLGARLGKPAFVRKDGITEMWRYDGAGCRAFFFLYEKNGAAAVRHVETLPRGAAAAADPSCLAALAPAKTS
jgi:hypothetical protein